MLSEYDEVIEKAKEEYEYEPPGDYYKDGYNTYQRMSEDKEEYVLFLRDPSVPPTNNLAERNGRQFKRKAHQVMAFRSREGVGSIFKVGKGLLGNEQTWVYAEKIHG